MSGDGTATEAAGRQDGQGVKGKCDPVREAWRRWHNCEFYLPPNTLPSDSMIRFFASPEGQAALAAFRGDSPALGPSSPPPPSREEQITKAAEKVAREVIAMHLRGHSDHYCVESAASALRSCWPSAAEGEGGPDGERRLRVAMSKVVKALDNGSFASKQASIEFLEGCHDEVRLVVSKLKAERDAALSKLENAEGNAAGERGMRVEAERQRDNWKEAAHIQSREREDAVKALSAAREAQAAAERERDEQRARADRVEDLARSRHAQWEESRRDEKRRGNVIRHLEQRIADSIGILRKAGLDGVRLEEFCEAAVTKLSAAESRAAEAERQRDEAREKCQELQAGKDAACDAINAATKEALAGADDRPIPEVSKECGFVWPDEPERQREVLERIARLSLWWRMRCVAAMSGLERERSYAHMRRRLIAAGDKLRRVRAAAVAYYSGQRFDRFAALHDQLAAVTEERDELLSALRARPASLPPLPPGHDWDALREECVKWIGRPAERDTDRALVALLDYVEALPAVLSAPSPPASPAPADALCCPPPLFVNQNA